jgi:hypothetical protein
MTNGAAAMVIGRGTWLSRGSRFRQRLTSWRKGRMSSLSIETQQALDALREAVAEALERKRRLGQYAIIWRDGRAVRLEPDGQITEPESLQPKRV